MKLCTYQEACTITTKRGKNLSELFQKTSLGWIKKEPDETNRKKDFREMDYHRRG